MDLLQVLNYWIYFVFYCSLWSNNRVCIMLLRYRSTWVAHMRNEGNFNQNKMSWSEYMDTWAQFWIWININHPCLSEYNFALNEPNRIRIFQLTCLYDAFLFWSALYSKYLCPCKHSYWETWYIFKRKKTSAVSPSNHIPMSLITFIISLRCLWTLFPIIRLPHLHNWSLSHTTPYILSPNRFHLF